MTPLLPEDEPMKLEKSGFPYCNICGAGEGGHMDNCPYHPNPPKENRMTDWEESFRDYYDGNTWRDSIFPNHVIDLIKKTISQEVQKERERWFISWDTASGGKYWAVHVGRRNEDGTTSILAGLDKSSDDGGNFTLADISPS